MTRRPLLAALLALAAVGCAPHLPGTATTTTADAAATTGTPATAALPSLVFEMPTAPATAGPPVPAGLPIGDPQAPMPGPGTCHLGQRNGQPVPDPACTPGATNPAVTQASIGQTICMSGWTKTVRPSTSVTTPMKRKLAVAYAMPPTGELDHFEPLSLGGAPSDPRNLWVEPGPIPNIKDRVEWWLLDQVCHHGMPLASAQMGIATDWTQYLPVATATATPDNEDN